MYQGRPRVLRKADATGTQHGRGAVMGYSRWGALEALGPVVYALRLDDGIIKIGYTTNLADRERTVRRQGKSESSEIIAVWLGGTYEDEQAIHARLTEHIAHGWEYYHPTEAVLAEVNRMREALSLAPLG